MTNCDKIRNAVRPYAGQGLSSGKVVSLVLAAYPGTNPTSIIPSDHAGPNPRSGRSYCSCCGTEKQIFNRSGAGYVVRSVGNAAVVINSHLRSGSSVTWRPILPAQTISSADRASLVEALLRLKPSIRTSTDRAWRRNAALRVIDCVLSLNRNYDSFVVPRLDSFERRHPQVQSVGDLKRLLASFGTPSKFVSQCLNYNDDLRAATLAKVVAWLDTVAGGGDYDTQISRLKHWAANAKPEDHLRVGIWGFGLGGFQYLRMLFGANTTKPDIHIQRFVASCVGHRVSDIQALSLLEDAAAQAEVSLRDLDTTIWESSARGAGPHS